MRTVVGEENFFLFIQVLIRAIVIAGVGFFLLSTSIWFFLILAVDVYFIVRTFIDISGTILVDEKGVEINGTLYGYNEIVTANKRFSSSFDIFRFGWVGYKAGRRSPLCIQTTSGRRYRINIANPDQIIAAIASNREFLRKTAEASVKAA